MAWNNYLLPSFLCNMSVKYFAMDGILAQVQSPNQTVKGTDGEVGNPAQHPGAGCSLEKGKEIKEKKRKEKKRKEKKRKEKKRKR
jgi:hypothetical protein